MIIVKNSWFPFGSYTTINLFGILFTKQDELSPRTLVHESIHAKQQIEMLFVFFYLWYGIEYLIVRLFHKTQNCSYHDVSFEEEAYANDEDSSYLYNRKHYAWFKYLALKSNHDKQQPTIKANVDKVSEQVAKTLSPEVHSIQTATSIEHIVLAQHVAANDTFVAKCSDCNAWSQIRKGSKQHRELTNTGISSTCCSKCNAQLTLKTANRF